MKTWLYVLLLLLTCSGGYAIKLCEIEFNADFPVDEVALQKATNLNLGEEYKPEIVKLALDNLRLFFYGQDQYYIQINLPELIPIDQDSLKLRFTLIRRLDSSQIKLQLSGTRYFSVSKLWEHSFIKPEAHYPLSELPLIMQKILIVYEQRGYLFATVQLDSLVADAELMAYLRIDEGRPFKPSRFIIQGNNITKESSLIKTSGLLGVNTFNQAILDQAAQNIRSRSYIRSCDILPLNEETLLIRVEEGRMTYLEGVLGLSEAGGKQQISGVVNINFANLWGTDRGIKLYWRRNPSEYSELNLSYHEAGHPSYPVAGDINVSRSNQDSLWVKSSLMVDIYYHSMYQKYGLSAAGRSVLPGSSYSEVERTSQNSFGAFWQFQNTSGDRIPLKGYTLYAKYMYHLAKGQDYSSSEGYGRIYLPIGKSLVAYASPHIKSYSTSAIQDYDLFSMGGFGSLRGYREDEFKSYRLGWVNTELRYMLGTETMLYALFDSGLLKLPENGLKSDNYGLGMGIKVGTRLGILSLEYALGYRDNSFSDIGLGFIHLGIDVAL